MQAASKATKAAIMAIEVDNLVKMPDWYTHQQDPVAQH